MSELSGDDADARLIDVYLDGLASQRDVAALQARLIASPAVARQLLALSHVECLVRQSVGQADAPASSARQRRRRRALWVAAIVLGAVAGLLAHLLIRRSAVPGEESDARRILFFDFESASDTYPRWDRAKHTQCPPGRAGHGCLSGIRMALRRNQVGMTLGDWQQPFLVYRPNLQARFAAWAGASSSTNRFPIELVFYVTTREATEAFVYRSELSGSTRWHEVAVPLSKARGWHSKRALQPTDRISAIHMTLPWGKDDVFIIDDFEIVSLKDQQ